jgi:hypothetical protein
MQLRPEDEFPHQPDGVDEAPWKDTYWFVARDPVRDVAVHAHLTLSANRQPPARATVLVKDGGREALGLLRTDATRTHGNTVGNDLLQIDVLNPEWDDRKRLRLSAHLDEVDVQLDLAGRFPAADINVLCPGVMPDRSGGPVGPAAGGVLRHLEHAMSFTGFLKWTAGDATSIEGFAIRDRSWGWRKTTPSAWAATGRTTSPVGTTPGCRPGSRAPTAWWRVVTPTYVSTALGARPACP